MKKNQNKLTQIQTCRFSFGIAAIFGLGISFLICCALFEDVPVKIAVSIPVSILLIFAFYFLISQFIFGIYRNENLDFKEKVIEKFNFDGEDFIKVKYLFEHRFATSRDKNIILPLLTMHNYSFYARLIDKDIINLLVKDQNENILFDYFITDFEYFYDYFEKVD